jgi:hypothetical protein
MVNNLINYSFYDIKNQWNCTGIFLAVQHEYDKMRIDKLKTSNITYADKWHDLRQTNIDTYWDFENEAADANHSYNNSSNSLWQSYNEGNTSYESYQEQLASLAKDHYETLFDKSKSQTLGVLNREKTYRKVRLFNTLETAPN